MKPLIVIGAVLCGLPAKVDDSFTCPVTKATPVTFEPTGIWASDKGKLFGDDKLFTLFPGNWHTTQPSERGYRVPKIVWGTAVFDLKQELNNTLKITGRRLDAESGPLQFDHANTAWIDPVGTGLIPKELRTPPGEVDRGQFFITSEFYVPTLGCWEVTGHFHGTDLKIVIDLK